MSLHAPNSKSCCQSSILIRGTLVDLVLPVGLSRRPLRMANYSTRPLSELSLERRIVGRIEEDRVDLIYQFAVFLRGSKGGAEIGISGECLPVLFGRLLARVGQQVDQFRLGLLRVGRVPEPDDGHA